MPFSPPPLERIDHLLLLLRKTLKPYRIAYSSSPRARPGDGQWPSFAQQALASELALVLDLAILRPKLHLEKATLPSGEPNPQGVEPGLAIDLQAAIAREILAVHFDLPGDSDNPELLWTAYRATLLIVIQGYTFPDVTEREQEAALRRLAARYVPEWDTTSTGISDNAQEGLQVLREDFDIDRPIAKWAALTVGLDRAIARWYEPRKIRLDRPWTYCDGKIAELPLLGLGEVGLVEHRYHRDEDRFKSVEGFAVFVRDHRRRIIAEAESWLEDYRVEPETSLKEANLTAAVGVPSGQPPKSRYDRILRDLSDLEREQRQLYLLLVAANHRRPDSEQSQAAEQLVTEVFPWPIHRKRWPAVLERASSRGDALETVRKTAAEFLLEGVWIAGQERAWTDYSELVNRLRRFLNSYITEALLGPKWRGLTETRDTKTQERLLEDLAAISSVGSKSSRQVEQDVTQLEAAVPEAGDLCYESFESNIRERELREELAVFLRKTTDQDRALWRVIRAVYEEEGKVNVSEGYRRFARRHPELPAASSESTFRRRWQKLENRLETWLAAG